MSLVVLTLLLTQSPAPSRAVAPHVAPALWIFRTGQQFFLEERHWHLLVVNTGVSPITTYVDYSALTRYQVKSVVRGEVILETTIERIRINNTNEASARAVEALQRRKDAKTNWRLTRTATGWQAASTSSTNETLPLILTFGSTQIKNNETWQQSWPFPLVSGTNATLTMDVKVKDNETGRLRVELRPRWEALPSGASMTLTSEATATAGLASYDRGQGRWDAADYRLKANLTTTLAGRSIDMKQDLTSYYRVHNHVPAWWVTPDPPRSP